MIMSSKLKDEYLEVNEIIAELGARIRIARVRRELRQSDVAGMTHLSRSTIQSIERGNPACSIDAVFRVLWVLNLTNELSLVADPGLAHHPVALDTSIGMRGRVYIPRKIDNDF